MSREEIDNRGVSADISRNIRTCYYLAVSNEWMEETDGIAAATDTSDDSIWKLSCLLLHLFEESEREREREFVSRR